ncbi:MAG TPA: glycine cleavage system protein H [Bacteroidales bacterium]|nr:glycine cleavage system protein H [Bacteroidales bacterium]HBZ65731.1 glycine cleavage system protein H [Bacteroidales bacterium]
MIESYAILPCNGLDKCAGAISREIAIKLCENAGNEMICPVFYRVAETKYNKIAGEHPLLVIDGCPTRCASKLAAEKSLKISKRITITEEAKSHNIKLSSGLRLQENENTLVELVLYELENAHDNAAVVSIESNTSYHFDYESFQNGKFIFRVPGNPQIYFNENDCWAYVIGNRARIGVTDFVQQNLSDILYFTPPEIGAEIDQFGEVGEIESSKSVFELISPVTGKVISVNKTLEQKPELINENPYESGWVAEIELTDFESDKELLIGFDKYFEIIKKKVEDLNG